MNHNLLSLQILSELSSTILSAITNFVVLLTWMGEEVSKEKKKDEKTDREELPRPNAPRQPEPIPSNVMYNPKHSTEQLTTAKGRKDNW